MGPVEELEAGPKQGAAVHIRFFSDCASLLRVHIFAVVPRDSGG